MDLDPKLLELGRDVAKIAAGSIPFTIVAKRMLGPAADEIAEAWRDSVRTYRFGRQLKLIKKAEKMASDAGFTPEAVPIKLLFPLLEGASLEENEELHSMWAALLANASNPSTPELVHPNFANTLKSLSVTDAMTLQQIWNVFAERILRLYERPPTHADLISPTDALMIYSDEKFVSIRTPSLVSVDGLSLDALRAASLVERRIDVRAIVSSPYGEEWPIQPSLMQQPAVYCLTIWGFEFMRACTLPSLK